MGSRGPTPKPIAGQIRDGTYRKDRHGVESLECEIPDAPGDLSPRAQAFWNVVSQDAKNAGYISRVDGKILRITADSWDIYCQAMDSIAEHGVQVVKRTQHGDELKSNTALKDRAVAWKQLYDGLRQFGLSPASRVGMTSMKALSGSSEEEEVARVLGIG